MAFHGGCRTTHRQTAHASLDGHVEQFLTDSKATAPIRNICDFFLFPKTNIQLKGRRNKDTAEIPAESLRCWTAPRNGSSRDDSRIGVGAGSSVGTPKGTVPTNTLRTPGTILLVLPRQIGFGSHLVLRQPRGWL
jgi:hypothetical protein